METIDVDDMPDPGITCRPCDDDPVLRLVKAEKCVVAAASKLELDRVLGEASLDGWRVVARGHDSETGRHEAKILRPLPFTPVPAADQPSPRKASERVRRRAGC